jgi:hypothetical protein
MWNGTLARVGLSDPDAVTISKPATAHKYER